MRRSDSEFPGTLVDNLLDVPKRRLLVDRQPVQLFGDQPMPLALRKRYWARLGWVESEKPLE